MTSNVFRERSTTRRNGWMSNGSYLNPERNSNSGFHLQPFFINSARELAKPTSGLSCRKVLNRERCVPLRFVADAESHVVCCWVIQLKLKPLPKARTLTCLKTSKYSIPRLFVQNTSPHF